MNKSYLDFMLYGVMYSDKLKKLTGANEIVNN